MPDVCPKCGAACKDGQTACTRCGLAADRMETFASDRDANVPDVLGAAWEQALAAWDDPARHDEVMRLVAQHDAYAWAAARYRTRTGDPIGERGLARVRKAAEATMMASAAMRKDTAPKPYRALTTILIMLIVAAGAGLLWATVMRNTNTTAAPSSDNATPAPAIQQIPRQPPPQKVR